MTSTESCFIIFIIIHNARTHCIMYACKRKVNDVYTANNLSTEHLDLFYTCKYVAKQEKIP